MTSIRTFAPLFAFILVAAYSAIAMASSGSLTAEASPLLVAAIATAVWHDRTEVRA